MTTIHNNHDLSDHIAPLWKEEIAEVIRLKEDDQRVKNWKRWGPYLAERQVNKFKYN
jgi:hypothetical protein